MFAVLAAIGATAAIWLVLFGGGEDATTSPDRLTGADLSSRATEIVAGLQPADKVDQVLLVGFEGTDQNAPLVSELADRAYGGILVGRANWSDPIQGSALVSALREGAASAPVAPLIVASQEGGDYRSLAGLPPEQREIEIGDFADPGKAEKWSAETAEALADAGFNLNLGPIVDVATIDSPIADRAFSDDPRVAALMSAAAVRGCSLPALTCAPGHFPGNGAASQNTIDGPATVALDEATLQQRDLVPFEAVIQARAKALVVSHSFYAAYDPVTPASLSSTVLVDLLRDELGFEGVAISSDLEEGAITAGYKVPEAAVESIRAGADLLIVTAPDSQPKVARALLDAVDSGAISEQRLDEAAGRVIDLKLDLGLVK